MNPARLARMRSGSLPDRGDALAIGAQHLETMFTLENIAQTKYELVEALPQDGRAFFPGDNDICLELYRKTTRPKALFGVQDRGEPLYMTAKDISHGPRGSTFRLVGPDGEEAMCTTRLLGGPDCLLGRLSGCWPAGSGRPSLRTRA